MRSKSPAIAPSPLGLVRWAPFGVPVVPEVRMMKRGIDLRGVEVRLVAGGDQPLQGGLRALALGPGDHPLDALDPLEKATELLVVDQQRRPLALDHVGELRTGEHRVQVERAGAELGRRDRRLDEAAVVAAHDRDPVAARDPPPGEGAGERVGAPVQLPEGERAALVDQGRVVRMVDRRDNRAGGGRCPALGQHRHRPRQLVGADRAQQPCLVQDLHLEGAIGGPVPGIGDARGQSSGCHPGKPRPIRRRVAPPRGRRFPRRGRSNPCPRCWSP